MAKQVSVSIRAALDSAFRATFQTADQRVRELNSSLRSMKQTADEMRGLSKSRENVASLTKTLAEQNAQLKIIQDSREAATAALRAFDDRIAAAAATAKKAKEQMKGFTAEIDRQTAAIQAAKQPTAEQIARLEELRQKMREAGTGRADTGRELASAGRSYSGKVQHIERLNEKLREHESALNVARAASSAAADKHARLRHEYERERAALAGLSNPTIEQIAAVKSLGQQVDQAARMHADAEREVQRLGRSVETGQSRIAEATAGLAKYEIRLESARQAAAKAAAEYDQYAAAVERQRAAMSGQVNPEQLAALKKLEAAREQAAADHQAARKEMAEATAAKKDHHKATVDAGKSVEHFAAQERDFAGNIKVTEGQVKAATAAVDRHSESLRKQGHDVNNLTEEQAKHNKELARQQQAYAQNRTGKDMRDRASDLRSQAMSHIYFTLGSGFIFTAPIREAVAFEKAMIRVKAMTGANAEEFSRLKKQARDLGASTIFTAKEAAEAQNELATAGYRTNDIIAVMPSMMALAESSMTSLARTAEITSEVLQGFNIDVSQMGRVGDSLTAAYLGSASSLESLGEMLKYVAASSVDVGSSLEQTLAASSVLHNSGVKGSMAGTTMRAIFLRMAKPPKELRRVMEALDIRMIDKDGNLRDWMDVLGDINAGMNKKKYGTARRAAVSKALGGEEHAPGASILLRSQTDGSLRFMQRTFELAPAYNAMSKSLLKMSDTDLRTAADGLGIKVNRAMTGGGIIAAISGSLKGLKGPALEAQQEKIFRNLKLGPKLEDLKTEEFIGKGKGVDDALKRLNISRTKALGGTKTADELTQEIKTQIQMLPVEEKLRYIEIFFSRTRTGVADLMLEFAQSGKNFDQLLKALEEAQTTEKTRAALSTSTAAQLGEVSSGINDIMISFGEAFIPILRDMIVWLKPLLKSFGEWATANKELVKNIMLGIGTIFAFNGAMALLKFSLSGVVDLLRAGKFIGKFFAPGTIGASGMRWLKTGAGIGMNYLTEGLGMLWGGAKAGAGKGGRKLGSAARWGGRLLKGGALRGWGGLLKAGPLLSGVIRGVGVALMGLGPVGWGIAAAVTAIAAGGYLIWKNWGTIGPKFQKMWIEIRQSVSETWTSIANGIGAAWDWVVKKISASGWIQELWTKFTGFFKGAYDAVKPYIKAMFPWMNSVAEGITAAPKWLSDGWDSGKKEILDRFTMPPDVIVPTSIEKASKGSYTQKNVITVNAEINVEAGSASPMQVAGRIKQEIQTAFRNSPAFDLFDPVEVS